MDNKDNKNKDSDEEIKKRRKKSRSRSRSRDSTKKHKHSQRHQEHQHRSHHQHNHRHSSDNNNKDDIEKNPSNIQPNKDKESRDQNQSFGNQKSESYNQNRNGVDSEKWDKVNISEHDKEENKVQVKKEEQKSIKQLYPKISSANPLLIEVVVNDRLGKKERIKCRSDDTIGILKKLISAKTGTKAEKIRLQKQYIVYKDNITLQDYEIKDGMGIEMYYN